ncbi:uncharacterized protein LOC112042066, partial [Lingula anatina]|uniref:Uncharacterized protein LOC112042066 n=1 Tax=Lingula anatina TaxID=7574 RepID=A0A2R2MNZ2_LINAN
MLSWQAEYEMMGDLPSRPSSVSDFNVGLVLNKADIEVVSSEGTVQKEASFSCPVNSSSTCNKTHTLASPRMHNSNLKITLEVKNGGYKIVSGTRVEFQGKTVQRQINIRYDTEAPYFSCSAGARKCDDEEMKMKVSQISTDGKVFVHSTPCGLF